MRYLDSAPSLTLLISRFLRLVSGLEYDVVDLNLWVRKWWNLVIHLRPMHWIQRGIKKPLKQAPRSFPFRSGLECRTQKLPHRGTASVSLVIAESTPITPRSPHAKATCLPPVHIGASQDYLHVLNLRRIWLLAQKLHQR